MGGFLKWVAAMIQGEARALLAAGAELPLPDGYSELTHVEWLQLSTGSEGGRFSLWQQADQLSELAKRLLFISHRLENGAPIRGIPVTESTTTILADQIVSEAGLDENEVSSNDQSL